MKAVCLANMAACDLINKDYVAAFAHCRDSLKMNGDNVKALLRRAKVHEYNLEYRLGVQDLLHILQVEPMNVEAKKHLKVLQQKVAKYDAQEKQTFAGMFDRKPKSTKE